MKISGALAFPLLLSAAILVADRPALAQDPAKETAEESETDAGRLDRLFGELKREHDPVIAEPIARQIWEEWNSSGSATVDLLMQWTNEAMGDSRMVTALDLVDQIIVLEPDYAEGWNRRATIHFLLGNYAKSMADITHVLELEPRHFGALSGMGAIFLATGNQEAALDAFTRSLNIYPADQNAQQRVIDLQEELAGEGI